MPSTQERELTAREVQLIGQIIGPQLRESLQPQFDSLHASIIEKIETDLEVQTAELKREMAEQKKIVGEHSDDIECLKSNQKKALAGYAAIFAVISAVVSLVYQSAKDWVLRKLGLKK